MKKLFLIVICILISNFYVSARIPNFLQPEYGFEKYLGEKSIEKHICSETCSHIKKVGNEILSQKPDRNFDVISYELYMDWRNPLSSIGYETVADRTFSGINKITVTPMIDNLKYFIFDAVDLLIDSIYIETFNKYTDFSFSNNQLFIKNPSNTIEDTISFTIYYRYFGIENQGFQLYPKEFRVDRWDAPNEPDYTLERIAYTMSQLNNARRWMPCYDVPGVKSLASISVRVPENYTVSSNGSLDSITTHEDNSHTYYWSDNVPISTYLMVANASIYSTYSEWFNTNNENNELAEIMYYIWDDDINEEGESKNGFNAESRLEKTVSMLEFLSEIYGPYPFVKYGYTAVFPFWAGGMEHQTMVSIHRNWLRGWAEIGLIHEAAHHWFGNLITCETWADLWIQEGGATWTEGLWVLHNENEAQYFERLYNLNDYTYNSEIINTHSVYGVPDYLVYSHGYVLIYYKSSWFYEILKNMLGMEKTLETLNYIFNRFAFSSINSEQLSYVLNEYLDDTPIPIDTIFKQWIYSPGYPIYNVHSYNFKNENSKYVVRANLQQIQQGDNIPEVFQHYVTFEFWKDGEIFQTEMVLNNKQSQDYVFELDFQPSWVQLDISRSFMKVNDLSFVTSINEEPNKELINIYPNPINNDEILKISLHSPENSNKISIYDVLGNIVYKSTYFENIIQIPIKNFSKGIYHISIETHNGIIRSNFVVI